MLRAVSSVSFRAGSSKDLDRVSNVAEKPVRHKNPSIPEFEEPEKQVSQVAVAGGVAAALLATWVGLGIAVGRKGSSWEKIVPLEGEKLKFSEKVKNFFFEVGKSADDTYRKVFSKPPKAPEPKPKMNLESLAEE